MPYNNSGCNHSYSQPSYPSYSHPYVHHQNAHAYNHGYPSHHPALTYPGYGYSGGYSAPRYSSPSYASPSYGTPNVFSIIKTSPNDTDDNVCALNSYDTLCLDSTGSEDHLTITGDKTNKKVTFALKNLIFGSEDSSVATNTNYVMGATDRLITAPTEVGGADVQALSGALNTEIIINSSLVKVTAAATTTNKKLQAGTVEGQRVTLANVGAEDFDLATNEADSNLKDAGTANQVCAGRALNLVWLKDSTTAPTGIWYPEKDLF